MRIIFPTASAFCVAFLFGAAPLAAQEFDAFFLDKTLRVDYHHMGTKGSEQFSLDRLSEEGVWAGSTVNLVDTLNLGEYAARVYDRASSRLIWSSGFSAIFNEWQSTEEAVSAHRTFHESVRMPMPKSPVQFTILRRDRKMDYHEVFSVVIDPAGEINREKRAPRFKSSDLMISGDPHEKVDIVIMGDGYGEKEIGKFRDDAKHFNDVLFGTEPFASLRKSFNVRTIEVVSPESGIDRPDKNVWKDTPLGTTYNTFGSARYVLTGENRAWRDIAGEVPYDFVMILVNDNRYGGGGIYNLYTTCYAQTDAPGMEWQMDYVWVHEFGHSFGGLGDEYYSSQVSYLDFYQAGVEPWEPNLTTLAENGAGTNGAAGKHALKWQRFATADVPVPTPWEKALFDSLGAERGKLDRLAEDYYEKREPLYTAQQEILAKTQYAKTVGAFEGAGYASEGIYRPSADCRMFTLSLADFDPVCTDAIRRVTRYFSN